MNESNVNENIKVLSMEEIESLTDSILEDGYSAVSLAMCSSSMGSAIGVMSFGIA